MDQNEVLKLLLLEGFAVEQSAQFHPNIFLEKEHINIVVKEYKEDPNEKNIVNDVMDIKLMLKKMHKNSWNSYFFILLPPESRLSPYVIEKDPRGIRKYVIRDYRDFTRIPFLNLSVNLEDKNKFNNSPFIEAYKNTNIKHIINFIIQNGGSSRSLTNQEVNSAFYILFDTEEAENEN
ncbi:ABC-three component system middle component 1 [Bacillus subtilis]|uniref:ABC-three component system middle component 1 n=1 Tax=Bacillus subtilis TaxID=1423 RepID=UPI00046337E3|nr:ABC-three component system middle component 1 [Bacillus subtilis]